MEVCDWHKVPWDIYPTSAWKVKTCVLGAILHERVVTWAELTNINYQKRFGEWRKPPASGACCERLTLTDLVELNYEKRVVTNSIARFIWLSIRLARPSIYNGVSSVQYAAIRYCYNHRNLTGHHNIDWHPRQHLCVSRGVLEPLHEKSTPSVLGEPSNRWCWNVGLLHALCRRYCFIPWKGVFNEPD